MTYMQTGTACLMRRIVFSRLCLLPLAALILLGCAGASPEPTATPTKTPHAANAQPKVVLVPTPTPPPATPATPTAPPPTVTPTPLPGNVSPYTGLTVDDPQH